MRASAVTSTAAYYMWQAAFLAAFYARPSCHGKLEVGAGLRVCRPAFGPRGPRRTMTTTSSRRQEDTTALGEIDMTPQQTGGVRQPKDISSKQHMMPP
ncbi:hypothetical protein OPT61_g2679 [Boeremia exigua]|uniref:Uncharacterized protein n=1 Tax=Boeremia exigua TaxID=749465 RepID=A0ACC2IKP2_9PLEO|nr:hypothetical protein OPT61_g2679 [Boeremia exigua]